MVRSILLVSKIKETRATWVVSACLCLFFVETGAGAGIGRPFASQSCSTFLLKRSNALVVGHNLDQPNIKIQPGMVVVNKRSIQKEARSWSDLTTNEKPGDRMRWVSRYGSITCNAMGREFPDGGMNEAGLVVCEMTLLGTELPTDERLPQIFLVQWIQYLLDTCATVDEVLPKARNVALTGWQNAWHFFVADATGNAAVIEYIQGEPLIYTGDVLPISALCNTAYSEELKRLQTYEGFGGKKHVSKSDPDPRFLYAAQMLHGDDASQDPTSYAFSVLDRLSIPCTQWSILYDIMNRRVEFRTSGCRDIRSMSMSACEFSGDGLAIALDINAVLKGDVRVEFQPCTTEMNRRFISKDVDRISQMGPWLEDMLSSHGVTKETFIDRLATYPETTGISEQPSH